LRYKLHEGPLVRICDHALGEANRPHVLIIDEINRGNLPKLLGELLYALEYRGKPVSVAFRDSPLIVPENVYLIATMNSSGRSIGHIDVATRRRFALRHMSPNSQVVRRLWSGWGEEALGGHLAAAMDCLNRRLHEAGQHDDLGVGQSYFLPYSGPKDR